MNEKIFQEDTNLVFYDHYKHKRIKEGFLARDLSINGYLFRKNSFMLLYESGSVKLGSFKKDTIIDGHCYLKGTYVFFKEDGTVKDENEVKK